MFHKKKKKDAPEPVQVRCVSCGYTNIIYLPDEPMTSCPNCHKEMVIEELLDEGKSY